MNRTPKPPKRKQPIHNTPPSSTTVKKTKSATNIEEVQCEVCLVCDCAIVEASETTEGQDAVFCEGDCQWWIHRVCAGLTRLAFENLSESIPYLCSYCTFTNQSTEICNLKETVKALIIKIAELEGAKEPSLSSQAQSGGTPPALTEPKSSFKNAPRSQPIAPPERKLNVVVYGLEENPPNTTRQDRLQMDVKSAVSVFSKLEDPIDGNSIKDCYRLGKYNTQASRPRPLLIKFLRYSDASNLLNGKSKLSKPIYVKPDLTPEERAMESLLLKERKSLIEKGIGRQFIKIRNQSLFVFNKLHAKIQNQQLEYLTVPSATPSQTVDGTTSSQTPN